MAYNMTNFSASNNVLDLGISINEASGNWLSYGILSALFIVLLMTLIRNNNPTPEAFFGSSTICVIVSLLFLTAGLINIVWVVGFTFIWALSAISLYVNK